MVDDAVFVEVKASGLLSDEFQSATVRWRGLSSLFVLLVTEISIPSIVASEEMSRAGNPYSAISVAALNTA